jgi:hypothetical protein
MADVIMIQERMPRSPRKHVKLQDDAKILLFTGIRYERAVEQGRVVIPAETGDKVKH